MESNSRIQQYLAESKFVEAQKEAELSLGQCRGSETIELLQLYFESLQAQSRPLPPKYILALIDKLLPSSPEEASKWLQELQGSKSEYYQHILLIQIQIADLKGQTDLLNKFISEYQIARYEQRTPTIPKFVQELSLKYYAQDFQIKLQRLALDLLRLDLESSEALIQELIMSCFEKSSPRGTKEKLNLLYEILASAEKLYHLELYKNFCHLMVNGVGEKKDHKKIIELIIYVDDFKFQALLLNFLSRENLTDIAQDYSADIRTNEKYSYVYFDKFLPHLKSLFFQRQKKQTTDASPALEKIDLRVGKPLPYQGLEDSNIEITEEEAFLSQTLRHQEFSTSELLDVSVGLLQSEFFFAALKSSQLAYASTEDNVLKLKASFLIITCLLTTGDYRSALDHSLDALSLSQTQNDVLSFMYAQAEAHLRLKEYASAKSVLRKIVSIDSTYRSAKERLDHLNAV